MPTRFLIILAGFALAACGRPERSADTAVATIGPAVVEQAGDIAGRREAQPYIDSAYAWMASRDAVAAARVLGEAPVLLREHANMPTSAATRELRAGALALDSVIARMNAGVLPPVEDFRATTVRINLAEAEHHRSQAAIAWAKEDMRAVGAEMVMAADHLDRATRDAPATRTADVTRLLERAYTLGGALGKGSSSSNAEVTAVLTELARAIRRLADGSG
jgi:hypothetical protein